MEVNEETFPLCVNHSAFSHSLHNLNHIPNIPVPYPHILFIAQKWVVILSYQDAPSRGLATWRIGLLPLQMNLSYLQKDWWSGALRAC